MSWSGAGVEEGGGEVRVHIEAVRARGYYFLITDSWRENKQTELLT